MSCSTKRWATYRRGRVKEAKSPNPLVLTFLFFLRSQPTPTKFQPPTVLLLLLTQPYFRPVVFFSSLTKQPLKCTTECFRRVEGVLFRHLVGGSPRPLGIPNTCFDLASLDQWPHSDDDVIIHPFHFPWNGRFLNILLEKLFADVAWISAEVDSRKLLGPFSVLKPRRGRGQWTTAKDQWETTVKH